MYWGIAPEVNAFRLTMMGAGPIAHIPQITGFQAAAATHLQQGMQMGLTAAVTSPSFAGAGGAAMMAAALPSAAWISAAGAHAEAAAAAIQAGVDGYAATVAATIPYPVVVANRVREATLEATNILGQNTPAIAEANAEYAEYWGQNAGAMMGYLATVTGLLGPLSVPLAPVPMGANPVGMAAGAAAVAAQGAALGAQALSAGFSQGTSALSGVGSTGVGVSAGTAAGVASAAHTGSGQPQAGSPASAAPSGKVDRGELLGSAQAMMGPAMSAPSMLGSVVSGPLSQAGQLPSMLGGQFGGLMSPALSATGGLGGSPGALAGAGLASGSPWSGLGSANGGYAGGGSAVSAALTKPSAGAPMAGPVGLPAGWWNSTSGEAEPEAAKPVAGVRGAAAPASGAMGPGVYGVPGAAGRSRRSQSRELAEADKSVVLDGLGDVVPVLTDNGTVYAEGQGV